MSIEALIESLPENYSEMDRELIRRAYRVAEQAHSKQTRASGEPYITHCVAVAETLASLKVPPAVVAAGLLHDTVEDTPVTRADLIRDFGEEIANLVDGVTKLTELPRVSRGDQQDSEEEREHAEKVIASRRGLPAPEEQARTLARSRQFNAVNETLRKTFLNIANDPRVPLIKLADRLHNMRTLHYMREDKQKRIAQQTLDIFAPLASILGIWSIKWELEDLGFRYTNPKVYKEISAKLEAKRSAREAEMGEIAATLKSMLAAANLKSEIKGRPKHIYSIHRKMTRKGVDFEQVHDVRGVRVLVETQGDCYVALGVIHTRFRPVPGEFDDYIAAPKDNSYRSIHTTVIYADGKQLEVQIRTHEMHQEAEFGIAAHWRYKDGSLQDQSFDKRIKWLREVMAWDQDVEDADEFVEVMKAEVFQDRVYIFTPRGDVIDLPAGATPIDFAYHIHTDVGHRCRGAKVDGKLVSLDYILKTGETVQILTSKRGGPSRDWLNPNLNMVLSARARSKIKHWFKYQDREQNIVIGRNILEKELRRVGELRKTAEDLFGEFNFNNLDDFLAAIGSGDLSIGRVLAAVKLEAEPALPFNFRPTAKPLPSGEVEVLGVPGLAYTLARCCNPAPGDEITGYITRGKGATIHRTDCANILNVRDRERIVRVSWGTQRSTRPVAVKIIAFDRNGLAEEVFGVIAREKINIADVKVKTDQGEAVFDLILEISDTPELSRVLNRILRLQNVNDAWRVM
jgi:GTP pyrophosphokinase